MHVVLIHDLCYPPEGVCLQQPSEEEEMDEGHTAAAGGVAIPLHPPSLMHWLHQKLQAKQVRVSYDVVISHSTPMISVLCTTQPPPFPVLAAVCKRTVTLLKVSLLAKLLTFA